VLPPNPVLVVPPSPAVPPCPALVVELVPVVPEAVVVTWKSGLLQPKPGPMPQAIGARSSHLVGVKKVEVKRKIDPILAGPSGNSYEFWALTLAPLGHSR
jgi:hypothetical protein